MTRTVLSICLVAAALLGGCSDPDPPLAPSYRVVLEAGGITMERALAVEPDPDSPN